MARAANRAIKACLRLATDAFSAGLAVVMCWPRLTEPRQAAERLLGQSGRGCADLFILLAADFVTPTRGKRNVDRPGQLPAVGRMLAKPHFRHRKCVWG